MTESTVEITTLKLEGRVKTSRELQELLDEVIAQSKKRFVVAVEATFRFSADLAVAVEVQERGARMRVPGRGVYACSVNGLMNAVADVIREEHGGDPALLDVYQRLLEAS
jgi:hypothetical protein